MKRTALILIASLSLSGCSMIDLVPKVERLQVKLDKLNEKSQAVEAKKLVACVKAAGLDEAAVKACFG